MRKRKRNSRKNKRKEKRKLNSKWHYSAIFQLNHHTLIKTVASKISVNKIVIAVNKNCNWIASVEIRAAKIQLMIRKLSNQCNSMMAPPKPTINSISKKMMLKIIIWWLKNLLWLKLRILVKIKNRIKKREKMDKSYLNKK